MLWNKMTAVVDAKQPSTSSRINNSTWCQFEAAVWIFLCVWTSQPGCCDQEPCQLTKDLPMQSLCCSRVATSKLFNQVQDKQQIFFINLQLCPAPASAVGTGSETSTLSSPEYRKLNGKMRKSLMQRNSDYEYEFILRRMLPAPGSGLYL